MHSADRPAIESRVLWMCLDCILQAELPLQFDLIVVVVVAAAVVVVVVVAVELQMGTLGFP